MLLTVTPNPAIDRTLVVSHLKLGYTHRVEQVILAAGGKGLNVARAARTLAQPLQVCAPLGGKTGQLVAQLSDQEGFRSHWSWHTSGETRSCVLVVDPYGPDATALNEPGPLLSVPDWNNFAELVVTTAAKARMVTLSGSLPPGVPPAALADLINTLQENGQPVIVDTSGAALTSALGATPYGIKVNGLELGAVLGMAVTNVPQAVPALHRLRSMGITLACVSLGAQGALAASLEGICWARTPKVPIVSTVGCGDSMLAGLVTALLRDNSLDEALCLGVACGAADALTVGGGLIDPVELDRILSATTVEWLE